MKQNKYDDPAFFFKYSQMPRSIEGLNAAGEWHMFRALLPNLRDKRVLDLGCGFGWHCRYVREQQARSAVGVDVSERMLTRAKRNTNDKEIEYRRLADEGIRHTKFLDEDVTKYHRSVATYLNSLIDAGFRISKLYESEPTQEMIEKNSEMRDEMRRPMFLLIAADRV